VIGRPRGKELEPLPRKGRDHWGQVHVVADQRKPLPRIIPQSQRKR